MADYTSVLARAIAGKKTADDRRVVYDRARNALINQLRSIDPPLPEADIARQRQALEDSIRSVEATAIAQAQIAEEQARAAQAAAAAAPPVVAPAPPASPLSGMVREAEKLGQASAEAARAARGQLDPEPPAVAPQSPRVEPRLGPVLAPPVAEAAATPTPTPTPKGADPSLARVRTLPAAEPERPKRNRKPWIFGGIAVLVLAGAVTAGVLVVRPTIDPETNRPIVSAGQTQPPKINERAPVDPSAARPATPGAGPPTPAPAGAATVAQGALLFEENADNARGADEFRGTVTWRIDTEPGAAGPERVIRGRVEVPDRRLQMLMTIRRNTEQALPASHTIELLFDVAPDFIHGSVENVAGIRMKPAEQGTGIPLAGSAVRVTAGYFLVGLTERGPDRERNVVLLRDRPWVDIPVLYRNGRRAVLSLEKGIPGERVFQEAFQGWGG